MLFTTTSDISETIFLPKKTNPFPLICMDNLQSHSPSGDRGYRRMANAKQHLSVHEKISMHNRNRGMNFSYANAAGLKIPLSLTTCQSSTGLPHFPPGACSARGVKGLGLPGVGWEYFRRSSSYGNDSSGSFQSS